MPSKVDKYIIKDKTLDKRVKLTDEQRTEIKNALGKFSQRKLAEMYNVSRRTIQFIHDPEKQKENLLRLKERGGSKHYYDKDKHKEYMRTHRKYKEELLKEDKLTKIKSNGKTN